MSGCTVRKSLPACVRVGGVHRAQAGPRKACVSVRAVAATMEVSPASKPVSPIIMNGQVLHSISAERLALVKSLDDFVEKEASSTLN